MRRTAKYMGLDVHQSTTVTTVREGSGRVLARAVLPTEGAAITEFFEGMRGTVHVVFEEGTQAQWLHDLLSTMVDQVVVCDRWGENRQGNNGDNVDADELSKIADTGLFKIRFTIEDRRALEYLLEDLERVVR